MPMSPHKGESEDDFIGRCMSEEKGSFPDQKQRLAVCYSKWRKTEKGFDESKHPRKPAGGSEGGQFAESGGGGGESDDPKQRYKDAVKEATAAGWSYTGHGSGGSSEWLEYTSMRHPQGRDADENVLERGASLSIARMSDGSTEFTVEYNTGRGTRTSEKTFTNLKDAMKYGDQLHGISKTEEVHMNEYQFVKIDDELGIVFGWAIVSEVDGEPYYDIQNDHIPEDSMLKATSEFMEHVRVGGEMHTGAQVGTVVHSMPLTKDIAKAFGIECDRTGWMVGYKPYSKAVLEKFRSGEYTGFSIGGGRILDEHVE